MHPDGLEDTPEARMQRIRELLLNNRPKQVVMAQAKSPQQKLARRLGLTRDEERSVQTSPRRGTPLPLPAQHVTHTSVQDTQPQQPTTPPPPPVGAATPESNLRTMMLSIKMQNDHLRSALGKANQELAVHREAAFAMLESDQYKDRRFIEEQEQHFCDYIMVEHAVGEREEVWKGIVRDLEERRMREVRELAERRKAPVFSPPVQAPVQVSAHVDPEVKRVVAELREELTQLRRQHNNDKALHSKERELWGTERVDLLAALEYHKTLVAKRSTVAAPTAVHHVAPAPHQPALHAPPMAAMEQQVRAREKKRARAQHMREKEEFMDRVRMGKVEAEERDGVEIEEDDGRKLLAAAMRQQLKEQLVQQPQRPERVLGADPGKEELMKLVQAGVASGVLSQDLLKTLLVGDGGAGAGEGGPPQYDPGYDRLFAHQKELHANFEQAPVEPTPPDLSSLLTAQLKEITNERPTIPQGASSDEEFDTDIL